MFEKIVNPLLCITVFFLLLFSTPAHSKKVDVFSLGVIDIARLLEMQYDGYDPENLGFMQKYKLNTMLENVKNNFPPDKVPAWTSTSDYKVLVKNLIPLVKKTLPKNIFFNSAVVNGKYSFNGVITGPDLQVFEKEIARQLKAKAQRGKKIAIEEMKIGGKMVRRYLLAPPSFAIYTRIASNGDLQLSSRQDFPGQSELKEMSSELNAGELAWLKIDLARINQPGVAKVLHLDKALKGNGFDFIKTGKSIRISLLKRKITLTYQGKQKGILNKYVEMGRNMAFTQLQGARAFLRAHEPIKKVIEKAVYRTLVGEIKEWLNEVRVESISAAEVLTLPFPKALLEFDESSGPLAIAGIGVLAAIAVPNFKRARENARKKACFANIRVMMGATEMYNMDAPVMLKTLDVDALIKKSYLKSRPRCPSGGQYSGINLDKDGIVSCSKHGSIAPIKPSPLR
ncbi:hypothetical protein ACFL35_02055 [Candidatus Riflebacteria bacterium]